MDAIIKKKKQIYVKPSTEILYVETESILAGSDPTITNPEMGWDNARENERTNYNIWDE